LLFSKINYLDNILSAFFSKQEIKEFRKVRKLNFSKKEKFISSLADKNSRKQLEASIPLLVNYQDDLDTLITFAGKRFPQPKFIELLFYLGENALLFGELNSASIIFNHILALSSKEKTPDNASAHAFLKLGEIQSRQARWRSGISLINKALRFFNSQQDARGSAKCENVLGTIYGEKGNIAKAKQHFEKSISLLDPKRDTALLGVIEMNLGITFTIQGLFDEAFPYFQRASIVFQNLNNLQRIAEVRHNTGMLLTDNEDYNAALVEFDSSIFNSIKIGNIPHLCISYLGKAALFIKTNDFPLADAFANKSLELSLRINDRLTIADIYKIKGVIERSRKNYILAENYLLTSFRLNKNLENLQNLTETSLELALLYHELRNDSLSGKLFAKTISGYKKLNNYRMVGKIKELKERAKKAFA
jgi:adenylate cyclase